MTSRSLLIALSLVFAATSAHAGDVYVVASPSLNLAADDIRDVFLGEKQFAGSVKLVPVDNGSLQADFLARALKVDGARYASVWSKKGFRDGLTPPPVRNSDLDVLAAIKANPGTVGYVSKPTADVKVLQKF